MCFYLSSAPACLGYIFIHAIYMVQFVISSAAHCIINMAYDLRVNTSTSKKPQTILGYTIEAKHRYRSNNTRKSMGKQHATARATTTTFSHTKKEIKKKTLILKLPNEF